MQRLLAVSFTSLLALGAVLGALSAPASVRGLTSPFTDIAGNPFEADIDWAYAEGITLGCNPPTNDLFCPTASVTREQMASFLARAFDLEPTSTDYFDDDTGSAHEADINALRLANITVGCNPPTNDLFCPSVGVSREQMASFLIRALQSYWLELGLRWLPENLPGFVSDRFDDYAAHVHVNDINGLAAAGITNGCGERLFCPTQIVPREQMAAFLHRARTSLEALPRTIEAAEIGVDMILGRDHVLAEGASSNPEFDFSAFTYGLSQQSRSLAEIADVTYESVTFYSLQTLADIDVDPTFPGIPACSLSIDSLNGTSATAAILEIEVMFVQPVGEPMSSIRFEVTVVSSISWSLEGVDLEGCPMEFTGDLLDHITGLLADSIPISLLTVTELCRGDDTQLFIPCPP
jgi:hypothetical protein